MRADIVAGLMELEGLASDPATMRLIDAYRQAFEATHDEVAEDRRSRGPAIGGDHDHDGLLSPEEMALIVFTNSGREWDAAHLDPDPIPHEDPCYV